MARKFEYQESDPDLTQSHADRKGDFDRPIKGKFKQYMAKEGNCRLRILPRTWTDKEGPRHWAFPISLHYGVGPDKGTYPCPQKMWGEECPICEERVRLDKAGETDEAKELRVSTGQLCWVIDRNHEEDGPMVFIMPSKKLESPICELSKDEDTGKLLKIDHPDEGHDIKFKVVGSGRNKDYTAVAVVPKTSPVSDSPKEQDQWLDFITDNPLPTVIQKYSADHIQRVFSGKSSKKSDEDEPVRRRSRDDDEPPARKSRGDDEEPARRRSRDDDDEPPPRSRVRDDDEEPRARRSRNDDEDDSGGKRDRHEDRETSRGRSDSERGSRGDDDEPPARGLREEVKSGLGRRSRDDDDDDEPPRRRSRD